MISTVTSERSASGKNSKGVNLKSPSDRSAMTSTMLKVMTGLLMNFGINLFAYQFETLVNVLPNIPASCGTFLVPTRYLIAGTRKIASTVETIIVVIRMLGSALMKSPFAPDRNRSGENASTMAIVDAMTEGATSLTPLYIASNLLSPATSLRSILSLTTIESSTRIPSAMISPMTEIWFRSTPSHGSGISPMSMDSTTVIMTAAEPMNDSPSDVPMMTATSAINNETYSPVNMSSTFSRSDEMTDTSMLSAN